MSVQHGGWAGNSTQLPRQRRPMTEDRRAHFEELLAKKRLEPYERGALQALARDGSATDRERARAKLGGPSGRQSRGRQPVTQGQAKTLSEAFAGAVERALRDLDDEEW